MDEEKKEEEPKEEKEEQQPAEDTGDRDKPTTTPLIDVANAAAERMEKANIETAKLLQRQEELEQRRALGGRSEVAPQEHKEETPEDYAKKVMSNDLDGKKD